MQIACDEKRHNLECSRNYSNNEKQTVTNLTSVGFFFCILLGTVFLIIIVIVIKGT